MKAQDAKKETKKKPALTIDHPDFPNPIFLRIRQMAIKFMQQGQCDSVLTVYIKHIFGLDPIVFGHGILHGLSNRSSCLFHSLLHLLPFFRFCLSSRHSCPSSGSPLSGHHRQEPALNFKAKCDKVRP